MLRKLLTFWTQGNAAPREAEREVVWPPWASDYPTMRPNRDAPAGALADPARQPLRTTQLRVEDWRVDYPSTFLVDDAERVSIFEPALKQYARAFRLGDPAFADASGRARWLAARNAVLEHVLGIIARSPWRESLVLRGSVLLRAFFGDAARAPGDIDWVVLPPKLAASDAAATRMIDDIARRIAAAPQAGEATIDVTRAARDAIWTYSRAEGVRLAFVWTVDGLPPGTMQLDFVFREPLRVAPVETTIPTATGVVSLLGATLELSLAWKLLWLGSDMYPQGKDLYDAVLLAERTTLPPGLLEQIVADSDNGWPTTLPLEMGSWPVDWANFKLEYPWIAGELDEWKRRLSAALARGDE